MGTQLYMLPAKMGTIRYVCVVLDTLLVLNLLTCYYLPLPLILSPSPLPHPLPPPPSFPHSPFSLPLPSPPSPSLPPSLPPSLSPTYLLNLSPSSVYFSCWTTRETFTSPARTAEHHSTSPAGKLGVHQNLEVSLSCLFQSQAHMYLLTDKFAL